jgi:hypothetical protein
MKNIKLGLILSLIWITFVSFDTTSNIQPKASLNRFKTSEKVVLSNYRTENSSTPKSIFFNPIKYMPL